MTNRPDRHHQSHRYRFTVLGRYPARTKGGEPAVTLNVAAGHDEHLIFSGTLTMGESEWADLLAGLRRSLGDAVEVVDDSTPIDDKIRAV